MLHKQRKRRMKSEFFLLLPDLISSRDCNDWVKGSHFISFKSVLYRVKIAEGDNKVREGIAARCCTYTVIFSQIKLKTREYAITSEERDVNDRRTKIENLGMVEFEAPARQMGTKCGHK